MLTLNGDGHIRGAIFDFDSDIQVLLQQTGAQARQLLSLLGDRVSVFTFMSAAQIADVSAGTMTLDVTANIQTAIAYCESTTQGQMRELYFPRGLYKISSALNITKQYIALRGDGSHASQIIMLGAIDGIKLSGIGLYLRTNMRGLSILGDNTSGHALDLSGVSTGGQVYESIFEDLVLRSGGSAFYAPGSAALSEYFNNSCKLVRVHSYNGHGFHVANGPGNSYESCYAREVPAGKAGYRMAGLIHLKDCNGLNEGDVWGAFGSKPDGTDGFQGDFGYVDYPIVLLTNCNLERFGSRTAGAGKAIRLCHSHRFCEINGGAIQRADADIPQGVGSYDSIISAYGSPVYNGQPIKFNPATIYLRDAINGTGTNTPVHGHFYFEFTGHLDDASQAAAASNITKYRVNADSLDYPCAGNKLVNDIFGGYAQQHTALSPRRLSVQHIRYATGAVITPVGANQAINVTGRSKVIVTPAAAASISTATFTATAGDNTTDYGRNGDLIIEAGNSNLTIKHAAAGANTFFLSGGADLLLTAGQIVRFTRSETSGNWWQVGSAAGGGGGSSGATLYPIFHNSLLDIWGANDPAVGPPSGVTTPGSVIKDTGTYWPGNQSLQSAKVTSSGTARGNGCTFTSANQPWGGPPGPASVSVTIPIYSLSSTRKWKVEGYDGTTYTLLGETALVANSWTLIKGTFTPAPGSTWTIIVSFWDGTNYFSGFDGYIGGIMMVRGTTPADTIEDNASRRNFVVITNTAPSFRPDFTGERWWDSSTNKWWMAQGQTNVGNWIILN